MVACLDWIEGEAGVGAVIITGAGRAFSAGADIAEYTATIDCGVDLAVADFVRRGQAMTARIEVFPKPVVAAVNGLAFGGGCEIVEACHLALAAETARFAKPEVAIGIPPTFGGTKRLPRLLGRRRALEHLLSGDEFGAEQALASGLVNRVVPGASLVPAAQAMARRILRHSPVALARILEAVARGCGLPMSDALKVEADMFARAASEPETRARLGAWLDRRRPAGS